MQELLLQRDLEQAVSIYGDGMGILAATWGHQCHCSLLSPCRPVPSTDPRARRGGISLMGDANSSCCSGSIDHHLQSEHNRQLIPSSFPPGTDFSPLTLATWELVISARIRKSCLGQKLPGAPWFATQFSPGALGLGEALGPLEAALARDSSWSQFPSPPQNTDECTMAKGLEVKKWSQTLIRQRGGRGLA